MKTDVLLIGSGIMSSTLGVMLKELQPGLSVHLFEVTGKPAQEASNGWNNAGTGHAGICELSYTPHQKDDGTVDVTKAISVFEDFEHSLQFWAHAARRGIIKDTGECLNALPHISLVHTEEQVPYLKARYEGLKKHHFFEPMKHSTDRKEIEEWAPLLMQGRDPGQPVAATYMEGGTDVNFGEISRHFCEWLDEQDHCGAHFGHRVVDLYKKTLEKGWIVTVRNEESGEKQKVHADFVFVGAGGGSLPLLQKSGIPEVKGYGGFPIGGQWMITGNPEVVAKHTAKVYGQALGVAPTMAVPHLDTRVIDGERYLLFGPFAAWTGKFLHNGGSHLDLPRSVRAGNIISLMRVGIHNLDLVKYLVEQGLQSKESRMRELRNFYPDAREEDWEVIDAGIRVQAIKQEPGEEPGIVHYGTEVLTSSDKTISALLGASPGASVSTQVMLECIQCCLPQLLESDEAKARMSEMIPNWNEDLKVDLARDRYLEIHGRAMADLNLV
ncbi:malate dehydrogenase (quinone) [Akkermansiaceae bacterium]|nr:malate dehydrogenase (quinone) [Akkermansiaceae bacterium]MDB4383230.1 malate dehydrogenase (quinone) [Akkermansiaceae bacterium]